MNLSFIWMGGTYQFIFYINLFRRDQIIMYLINYHYGE